jgi:hypothetical protein
MRIAIIVTSLFAVSFAIAYYAVLKRLEVVSKAFAQMVMLNATMREAFEASLQSPVSKEEQDIHKENFIKFLSDSRDWSFSYIEDVQNKINKMISDLKPDVEYFEKFKSLYDGHPSYEMLNNFVKSYKELQDLLPKEEYK